MNLITKISIKARMFLSFALVLVIFSGFGVFALSEMNKLGKLTSDLYEHPFKVSSATLRAEVDMMEMHRDMKDVTLSTTDFQLDDTINKIRKKEEQVYRSLAIIQQKILGEEGRRLHRLALETFGAWKQIRDEVIELIKKGDREGAVKITREKGAQHVALLERQMLDLTSYALNVADNFMADAQDIQSRTRQNTLWIIGVVIVLVAGISLLLLASILGPLTNLKGTMGQIISTGKLVKADLIGNNELSVMASHFNDLIDTMGQQDWLKTGIARLNEAMQGDLGTTELASKVISEISTYLDAQLGAIYLAGNGDGTTLSLLGSYAYKKRKDLSNVFKQGEGLVGQAALEKQQILVRNVPEDYVKITSGLGERIPRFICVTPFISEDRVKGVVEIGTLDEITDQQMEYLAQTMPPLAIAVESAQGKTNLAKSLEESQAMSEELQAQQEELKTSNEELEEQTQRLQASEEELKTQQEELQVTNEELAEKNDLLERQTREVEAARKDIEEKAEEVAVASKYKSEFLANMSHELRTPLNSLLLLAGSLKENKDGNLTDDQVESLDIIHGSGNDLLNLINEILDLSKIEAGRMDLNFEELRTSDLAEGVRMTFGHVAEQKGLSLEIVVSDDAPGHISIDRQRVDQIIRNFMSNAVKFTETGSVTVTFSRPGPGVNLSRSGLSPEGALSIAVKDTGTGIEPEKQKMIFEAFQQADGGTSRRYGGTGLGLAISKELARLLGGEIQLESRPGEGSTFTFYLPIEAPPESGASASVTGGVTHERAEVTPAAVAVHLKEKAVEGIPDDRDSLKKGDRVLLIIEDDPNFAKVLYRRSHEGGFRCVAAPTGEEGLRLAKELLPTAILLDLRLPGMDGWSVLSALKDDPKTRHILVHIISVEEATTESLRRGAIGHLTKPVDRDELEKAFVKIEEFTSKKVKTVLIAEDDKKMRKSIVKLIGNGDVQVDEVASGEEALDAIRSKAYDCVILDLGLSDISGEEVLRRLAEEAGVETPPIIVHTARDLTREEAAKLRERAETIILKDVRSQERLLDEVSLFLHSVVSEMPAKKRRMITDLHVTDAMFAGKKVLIVDDDMRTAFALSKLLTDRGVKALKAEDGKKALEVLEKEPDVDLVLMDIMMPVMDGYETMKKIRSQKKFWKLPMIALTAKAMKEDRERCIEAGASEYLPKPVDPERLISMMRVWLYR